MAEYIERETARAQLILNDELHAADLIKSIPAADVRPVEWIPVTERLPENGCYVLAYEDGDILLASYSGGEWLLRDMYEIVELNPTYWMPLPEPPKEET